MNRINNATFLFLNCTHSTCRHHIHLELIYSISSQGLTRLSRNLIVVWSCLSPCCELCGLPAHQNTHVQSYPSAHFFDCGWALSSRTVCLGRHAGPARPTLQASEVACIYIHPSGHQHSELAQISAPRYPKTELSVRSRTSSHVNTAIHELRGTQHERFAKYLCPLRTDRNARSTSTMARLRLCVCVCHSFSSVHMWGSY